MVGRAVPPWVSSDAPLICTATAAEWAIRQLFDHELKSSLNHSLPQVMLVNVDALFWLIALIQKTTWLIDPYWTIIPVMIHAFYAGHPLAHSDPWRAFAASALIRTCVALFPQPPFEQASHVLQLPCFPLFLWGAAPCCRSWPSLL